MYIKKASSAKDKAIIKFFLLGIEKHLSQLDYEPDSVTIEHILPENPAQSSDWNKNFSKQEILECVNRLGNYILLTESDNKKIKNLDFGKKLEVYKKSKFELAKHIAKTYNIWDAKKVKSYQKYLAQKACAIWRINF